MEPLLMALLMGGSALTDIGTGMAAGAKTATAGRKQKKYLAQATQMMEQDPLLIMLREQFPDLFSQEVWDELLSQQRMGLTGQYDAAQAELASKLGGAGMAGSPAGAYAKASLESSQGRDWSKILLENEMQRRQSFQQNATLLQALYPLLNPGVNQRMMLFGAEPTTYAGTNMSGSMMAGLMAALGGKGLGASSEYQSPWAGATTGSSAGVGNWLSQYPGMGSYGK